jgi:LacI family transcriptional regulator
LTLGKTGAIIGLELILYVSTKVGKLLGVLRLVGVTLKEIAKKAGLSVSTVSMALRNDSRISVETLQKVHRVASELNYVPNVRARAFVSRRTMTIGLVIPNLENSFYAELVHSIEDEIGRTNYNLILGTTDDKEANEIR